MKGVPGVMTLLSNTWLLSLIGTLMPCAPGQQRSRGDGA